MIENINFDEVIIIDINEKIVINYFNETNVRFENTTLNRKAIEKAIKENKDKFTPYYNQLSECFLVNKNAKRDYYTIKDRFDNNRERRVYGIKYFIKDPKIDEVENFTCVIHFVDNVTHMIFGIVDYTENNLDKLNSL